MDVQKPEALAELRGLEVGQQPVGGWSELLKATPAGTATPSPNAA
ncbi:hypothetical protein [Streptomyces sp. TRM68367]|nr:hypothetical protein [Streptomyces sp. TRM68367]